eukprot:UN1052
MEQARQAALELGGDPLEVYSPWFSIDMWQQALLALHGLVGDGALAVAASVLLLRAVTWPWNRRALQRQCDRTELMPVFMDLMKARELVNRRRGGRDGSGAAGAAQAEADFQRLSRQIDDFTTNTHFSPVQGMGYQWLCVIPLSVHALFTLRGMLAHPDVFHSFVLAPALWADSLVLPDPFCLLPLFPALAVLANVELSSPSPARPKDEENALYMTLVMRGAMLTFVPVAAMLPSAMHIFMGTNVAYTTAVTWVYRRYFWKKPTIEPRWLVSPADLAVPEVSDDGGKT